MHVPTRTYDPIRYHRGSRGFAAFIAWLNGAALIGFAAFVAPAVGLDALAATWLVLLTGAAGIAHMAAVVGLIRGRAWGGALVAYLSAAGIPAAATVGLLAATGLEVFGAEPRTVLGTSVWMIGTWLVASRFAVKPFGFTPHAHRAAVRPARPTADTRPQTGLRKARPSRPVVLPTPRIVQPTPSRMVLRPLTTPTA